MRSVCCAAGATLLACNIGAFAGTGIPCSQTLSRPLASRVVLMIDSTPAGLEIVGTDREVMRVSCTAGSEETASKVTLQYSPAAGGGRLSIGHPRSSFGSDNNLEVKIELPRRTNLRVHMGAGKIDVEEVKGDKEIELGAGEISISPVREGEYRRVNASVSVGSIEARAFGVVKGGFFPRFTRTDAGGDYLLEAHVTTGEIDLVGKADQRSAASTPDGPGSHPLAADVRTLGIRSDTGSPLEPEEASEASVLRAAYPASPAYSWSGTPRRLYRELR